MCKKLVLLKTFYYRNRTQDNKIKGNTTYFVMNPSINLNSLSVIYSLTDKNYNKSIENEFIEWNVIRIPHNNPNSGITK